MKGHNESQKTHYAKIYADKEVTLKIDDSNLWEWARAYPMGIFSGFANTMKGSSVVITCCGAGRELTVLHRSGLKITATDLTVGHLKELVTKGILYAVEEQNAERLSYEDNSFDYGFVNAGLHHLSHPHAGLTELMRTSRKAAIFIESQDSVLFAIRRLLGRTGNDFECSGNYVYRWNRREIEKISSSAHAHSYAVKTAFLPIMTWMTRVKGKKMNRWIKIFSVLDKFLSPYGNLLITIIFKAPPSGEQLHYLKQRGYNYKELISTYPEIIAKNIPDA